MPDTTIRPADDDHTEDDGSEVSAIHWLEPEHFGDAHVDVNWPEKSPDQSV
jgi:hypothetical protein